MKVNPLVALGWAGQSPWLDYIHRGMIASGELGRRIAEDGIRGVTSNPTIFEKAVSSGHDYDAQIFALARAGTPLPEAYKAIVTDDIRAAADVLRPVHDASRGDDGYVSLEVDPDLARDTKATIARARELFDAVGRPNVMIKIPGTKEGLPAVEETIASGVPVNITLIFSAKRYEEVADAYMRGLERLLSSGGDPRKVASVASFFVSRIDTAVDALLLSTVERWPGSPKAETALSLLGKTAVASARVAYGKFLALTGTPRWKSLAARGARVQRPLWASTGTKNPKYSDVKYVEELIGPDTVNTMPPQTMDAFRDHGTVADALSGAEEEAKAVLDDYGLMETGIEEVCARLEEEGVKSFLDSYRKLLAAVEKRLSSASA
ncbi:MAG: transaldolase [Deltaproteobacteria bacterium]|nr:transaldolase [Deltaproteobacteria bacterium]MBP2687828.1 transaldolase [Deltaproteobacteria bacterium]MBS1243599.1 transaldolase [Deltaproteobacteria bacterium]